MKLIRKEQGGLKRCRFNASSLFPLYWICSFGPLYSPLATLRPTVASHYWIMYTYALFAELLESDHRLGNCEDHLAPRISYLELEVDDSNAKYAPAIANAPTLSTVFRWKLHYHPAVSYVQLQITLDDKQVTLNELEVDD
nr:hypothetical protein [Tanacetum cinerariifolium]